MKAYATSAVLLVVFLAGCAAQVEQDRAAPNLLAHYGHMNRRNELVAAGVILPSELKALDALLKAETRARDAYYAAIDSGDSQTLLKAKKELSDAVEATSAELEKFPSRRVPR